MRDLRHLASCEVPGCVRYAGKALPGFCRRCWDLIEDGERAMLLFSVHAPFFRRYGDYKDIEETPPAGGVPGVTQNRWYGAVFYADEPPARDTAKIDEDMRVCNVLRRFEASTTRAAICRLAGDRLAKRLDHHEDLRQRAMLTGTPAPAT